MEAVCAYNRWQQLKQHHQQQGGGPEGRMMEEGAAVVPALIDAMVNAAAGLLPMPQRNVSISAAAADGDDDECGEAAARRPGGSGVPWPAASRILMQGFNLQADANVPVMFASVSATGDGPLPPFMSSLVPPKPPSSAAPPRGPAGLVSSPRQVAAQGGVRSDGPVESSSLTQMDYHEEVSNGGGLAGIGGPAAFGSSDAFDPPPLESTGGGGWSGLFMLSAGGEGTDGGGRGTFGRSAPNPKRPKAGGLFSL